MREALGDLPAPRERARIELLWASPRELLNIVQAAEIGCDIITVTPDLLEKLELVGKELGDVQPRDRADVLPRRAGRRVQAVSDVGFVERTSRRR